MRYFITFSYNGTQYSGMQIQPNALTIQEVLEEALTTILSENIRIAAAGRTDTGVHAKEMVAHFETKNLPDNIIFRLNSFLPKDIAVKEIRAVKPDIHARFHATAREYKYYVIQEKNPFHTQFHYLYKKPLDVDLMNQAADMLLNILDFSSFEKKHSDNKTSICKVTFAKWKQNEKELIFTIKANRFLRNMVRAIVGTLLEVGSGKITLAGFKEIIDKKDRTFASTSAEAKGLFLTHVEYPSDIYL